MTIRIWMKVAARVDQGYNLLGLISLIEFFLILKRRFNSLPGFPEILHLKEYRWCCKSCENYRQKFLVCNPTKLCNNQLMTPVQP